VGRLFQYSWAYQIFIFGLSFGLWATFYYPMLWIYQANNKHRTFQAAIAKEKAFKRAMREKEQAEQTASGDAE